MTWEKKRKGSGFVYTHPLLKRAIFDTNGFGVNPGIYWNGRKFKTLEEAKKEALKGGAK